MQQLIGFRMLLHLEHSHVQQTYLKHMEQLIFQLVGWLYIHCLMNLKLITYVSQLKKLIQL
jgi:hypothetical protein